jgi:hypothetical protein
MERMVFHPFARKGREDGARRLNRVGGFLLKAKARGLFSAQAVNFPDSHNRDLGHPALGRFVVDRGRGAFLVFSSRRAPPNTGLFARNENYFQLGGNPEMTVDLHRMYTFCDVAQALLRNHST